MQRIKELSEEWIVIQDASIGEFYTYNDRMENETLITSSIDLLEWVLGEWD